MEQQPFSVFLRPEKWGEFLQSDEADETSAEKVKEEKMKAGEEWGGSGRGRGGGGERRSTTVPAAGPD